MKALIVQGPAFYGVNVRLITEAQAETIEREHGKSFTLDEGIVEVCDVHYVTPNNPGCTQTFGFDTGWWAEGEKLMDKLLIKVL